MEITISQIVTKATDEQLDKMFSLSHQLGEVLEEILRREGAERYIDRLASSEHYAYLMGLQMSVFAEMGNRS